MIDDNVNTTEISVINDQTTSESKSTPAYQNAKEAALAYHAKGLSVIPLDKDKSPAVKSWKEFQTSLPTKEGIEQWYAHGNDRVAIICGAVSGNLECLDIDEKYPSHCLISSKL